jgi:hypothetical protein
LTSFYVSKGTYKGFNLTYHLANGEEYNYLTPDIVLSSDITIEADKNLKAYIDLPKATYEPYEYFNTLGIKDSKGNKLVGINNSANLQTSRADFSSASGTFTSTIDNINPFNPQLQMPVFNGSLNMTYSVSGLSYPVSPVTVQIQIDGAQYMPLNAPGNLSVTEITEGSTKYAKLTWDAVANAGYYVIYRSMNGGSFVYYDRSDNLSYIDQPYLAGVYKYYVCGVKSSDYSVGAVSSIVTYGYMTSMLGDVNNDSRIDMLDYNLVKQYLINKPAVPSFDITKADVDNDGGITSRDLGLIERYTQNKLQAFPGQ